MEFIDTSSSWLFSMPAVPDLMQPRTALRAAMHERTLDKDPQAFPGHEVAAAFDPVLMQTLAGGNSSICRIPDFALPMQPKLLKQINSFNNKEELLAFVASCQFILDPINLVTCVYRLARMFYNLHNETKKKWRLELCQSSTFQLLLRTIQSQLLKAQLLLLHNSYDLKGLDARCVSNLIWAVVKLELAMEPGSLGTELVLNVSPLVIKLLPQSSSQGLANLLWAYAKLPVPPVDVMMSIILRMTLLLTTDDSSSQFDAQALSNSVWALAHTKSRMLDMEAVSGSVGCVLKFLETVAATASQMLRNLHGRMELNQLHAFLLSAEQKFSCQALVNIAWSFATILGEQSTTNVYIRELLNCIRKEAILRLRATAAVLQQGESWIYRIPGGFNEQALSNIVYAFEKAQVLDRELLRWVFSVAALRLDRKDAPPTFKPQELCTLLRAAHFGIAEPWQFLANLMKVVHGMPWIINTWSPNEMNELTKAFNFLRQYTALQSAQQSAPLEAMHMNLVGMSESMDIPQANNVLIDAASFRPPLASGVLVDPRRINARANMG